jgi:hypothetical protein
LTEASGAAAGSWGGLVACGWRAQQVGDARANRLYWERMVIAKLDRSSLLTHSGINSRVMAASGPAKAAVATHNKFTFFVKKRGGVWEWCW